MATSMTVRVWYLASRGKIFSALNTTWLPMYGRLLQLHPLPWRFQGTLRKVGFSPMQRAKKYIPTYTLFMAGVFHSPKPSKKKRKRKRKERKTIVITLTMCWQKKKNEISISFLREYVWTLYGLLFNIEHNLQRKNCSRTILFLNYSALLSSLASLWERGVAHRRDRNVQHIGRSPKRVF